MVLLVALLIPLAAYLVTRRDVFEYVHRLSLPLLAITIGCQLGGHLFWNGAMLLPLRRALPRLGFWELMMVRSGGLLASYVVPVAGTIGVRVAYLRRHGLGYADFAWATLVTNLLGVFSATLLAVGAGAAIWQTAGALSAPVVGLTAGLLVLGVGSLAALLWLPRAVGHRRLRRWPSLADLGRRPATRGTILAVSSLALGRHVFNFVTFGLLYRALSPAAASVLDGGLVYAITTPLRTVALTPANLGVNEWATAAVGRLLAFDLTTGLLVGLVFRAVSIAAQVVGAAAAGGALALAAGTAGAATAHERP